MLTLGLTVPIILTAVFFATQGALAAYFRSAFLFNLSYTSYQNTFLIPNGLLIAKALPLLVIVGYFLYRFYGRWKKAKKYSFSIYEFLIIWLAFSFYGATFGGRPYEHYLIQALPAFCLILASGFANAKFRTLGFSVAILVVSLTLLLKFTPWVNPAYYPNFFKFVFNQISFDDYANSFNAKTARNYAVANYLTGCEDFNEKGTCELSRSSAGDRIYIFANEPAIYFLSGLDLGSPYTVFFHIANDDKAKKATLKKISEQQPTYILVEEPPVGSHPELEKIIVSDYNLVVYYENMAIYKLDASPNRPIF
jgi:hypothetical protein